MQMISIATIIGFVLWVIRCTTKVNYYLRKSDTKWLIENNMKKKGKKKRFEQFEMGKLFFCDRWMNNNDRIHDTCWISRHRPLKETTMDMVSARVAHEIAHQIFEFIVEGIFRFLVGCS